MLYFTVLLYFVNLNYLEACIATSPGGTATTTAAPTTASTTTASTTTASSTTTSASTTTAMSTSSSTTTAPIVLRTCDPSVIALGTRNDDEFEIDVTTANLMSTQIGSSMETENTVQITCTADAGNFASMDFNNGGLTPVESVPNIQTVTITVMCNSLDMMWLYNGVQVNDVRCLQA